MASANTQSQPSLASLPLHMQSDTHITSHLASRFHSLNPTATISSHALISINTYSTPSVVMGELEKMAARMWKRLGTRGENQVAVFIGESGSGKSTLRQHLLQALADFSSTPLSQKITLFAFLFDSLTSTKSHTTPQASKAGMFLELQYDGIAQTLIGAKLLDHRLERSRVANVPTGERNFHILYYLLAGTSPAEKAHLGLDASGPADHHSRKGGVKRWRYLGHPTQLKVGVNDPEGFQHFKTALRKLEFPRSDIAEICQILATILHIGQLEFASSHMVRAGGDESVAMEGGEHVIVVKNKDALQAVSAFLGVSSDALEQSLGYKTKNIKKERVTIMLDANGARAHADELARTLYSMLVAWIIEAANERLCAMEDGIGNTISIVDFPGFAQASPTGSTLDQLLNNAATESIYNFCLQSFFENKAELLESEEVAVEATSYFDNSDVVKALLKSGNGMLSILDDQTRKGKTESQFMESCRKRFDNKFNGAITISDPTAVLPGSNFATTSAGKFTVRHFAGEVEYAVAGLMEENGEVISADLMNLFQSTTSEFVGRLFKSKIVSSTTHARDKNVIMQGQLSSKPLRMPSVMRKKGERPKLLGGKSSPTNGKDEPEQVAAGQYLSSLEIMTKAMSAPNTNPYFIFCLKPNDRKIANQFDSKCVRTQIRTFGIAEISQRVRSADFSVFLPFGEFLGLADADSLIVGSEREKAEQVIDEHQWPESEAKIGTTGVFLSERCWDEISGSTERGMGMGVGMGKSNDNLFAGGSDDGSNNLLTPTEGVPGGMYGSESRLKLIGSTGGLGGHIYGSDRKGYFPKSSDDARSEAGASAFHQGDMFRDFETRDRMVEKGEAIREQEIEEHPVSASRKRWMFLVWCMTWFVPDFAIRICGRMKRKDMREAWREKLAINFLIWLSCGFAVFILIFFPMLICPKQFVFSNSELASKDGGKNHMESGKAAYVAIRGTVYDLGKYASFHRPTVVPVKDVLGYSGRDASSLFPVQVSAVCGGKNSKGGKRTIDKRVLLDYKGTNATSNRSIDRYAKYHDFRYFTNDYRPDWWMEQRDYLDGNYKVGDMGYTAKYVKQLADKQKTIAILKGKVYDLTEYMMDGRGWKDKPSEDEDEDDNKKKGKEDTFVDTDFMDQDVLDLFTRQSGTDLTKMWETTISDKNMRDVMETCLENLFLVGVVDTRNSPKCLFAIYLLLAVTIMLVSVIGFKFLAALQFTRKNMPENLDKFIICQIPAYTEDEESLRASIDSLARMKYDDKRKLMVVICDGMIIGQGNDRPTPRIVLDILGVSEEVDPQPLSFESLGEGQKQHNMGKVYSGLYEVQGHIVPFLVIVKVGKPSEVTRPGNRGKRDSQMLLMRFLNRVHYNEPMNPLELEMHHQIRNIIGVNPTFYDFLFQIDADTTVAPDAANRMVAAFLHDTRIIALCGETGLRNAKRSFITMIQVYEYYISHNLAKAFESLFGSVTCLPGCFSMYRLHAEETRKPLFVSKEVVNAYAEIRVDTLHMKNLLHLGEDRYLTTLLLKHHPSYKTKYIFSAHAWTVAPEDWSVFMSQRRRWINSTLHNLMELIPMSQLCGFCCFSMRFVVFLDLMSTVIQPVTVAYIAYLIVLVSQGGDVIPMTAFILLGAIYGLQAFIFIVRRKWEMVGWMIMYILAIPVFSFALPLYAFWHMDDFSWGNTRIVTGEAGKKIVISNEGKFDPSEIPRKKWEDYQAGLWGDAGTQMGHDDMQSEISGYSYATKSYAPAPMSEYHYSQHPGMPQSRPMSTLDMHAAQLAAQGRSRSRLSLAPSELMSQRGSQFFQVNDPSALEMSNLDLPSDDAIVAEIKDILRTADLMTVTKKSVKAELERRFGVSLEGKRAYVNSATEAVLSGQL